MRRVRRCSYFSFWSSKNKVGYILIGDWYFWVARQDLVFGLIIPVLMWGGAATSVTGSKSKPRSPSLVSREMFAATGMIRDGGGGGASVVGMVVVVAAAAAVALRRRSGCG